MPLHGFFSVSCSTPGDIPSSTTRQASLTTGKKMNSMMSRSLKEDASMMPRPASPAVRLPQ